MESRLEFCLSSPMSTRTRVALLLLALLAPAPLHAQAPTPAPTPIQPVPIPSFPSPTASSSPEARQAESRAAWKAAEQTAVRGPASVTLRDEAKLEIPPGMVFIPQEPATRLSRAMGNTPGPNFVGIVTNFSDDDTWIVFVNWTPDGYIRDDDAKDLNPDDILENLTEGTEAANKDRLTRGFPELTLKGWTQRPEYNATTHRLSWSLRVVPKDEPDGGSINFNTRALGRNGYFSLNLVDRPELIEKDRPISAQLLTNLEYEPGKRYTDFNGSTDRVAEYGLAGLIGVVALKKLGLIALAGAFILKFAKLGVLAVVGAGVALKRIFRKKPSA